MMRTTYSRPNMPCHLSAPGTGSMTPTAISTAALKASINHESEALVSLERLGFVLAPVCAAGVAGIHGWHSAQPLTGQRGGGRGPATHPERIACPGPGTFPAADRTHHHRRLQRHRADAQGAGGRQSDPGHAEVA